MKLTQIASLALIALSANAASVSNNNEYTSLVTRQDEADQLLVQTPKAISAALEGLPSDVSYDVGAVVSNIYQKLATTGPVEKRSLIIIQTVIKIVCGLAQTILIKKEIFFKSLGTILCNIFKALACTKEAIVNSLAAIIIGICEALQVKFAFVGDIVKTVCQAFQIKIEIAEQIIQEIEGTLNGTCGQCQIIQ
ncbi:unnamed protein product [Candida verbasci]|uniref:Uncharacterized protein n=1 Tax=Candida verbasci TaxID=1227364 RepID=A0A9W4TWW9_9ASCO|nr:unnamed protein product [Candida verbasci]